MVALCHSDVMRWIRAIYSVRGFGTGCRSKRGIPAKSSGLHVCRPRPCAMALAAISASYTRAAGLRPAERRAAATPPTAHRAIGVERQNREVCFGLLQVLLSRACARRRNVRHEGRRRAPSK